MSNTHLAQDSIDEIYRRFMDGHIYVRETVNSLVEAVEHHVGRLGPEVRVLELGSHGGFITHALLKRCPQLQVVVCEQDPKLVELGRARFAERRVVYHTEPIETFFGPVDIVVSIARHHHLPQDYLPEVRRVLSPHGVYVLADELCPEYCSGDHHERIERAELIHVARGHVLTSAQHVREFHANGQVPGCAVELEALRKRALWRWYRFVVDHAVERGYFDIALQELQSTLDDLVTGSDAEHKFSPLIVERQLALAGFRQRSKELIGSVENPGLQSMFVYEFEPATPAPVRPAR